jgi:hypothetical protein
VVFPLEFPVLRWGLAQSHHLLVEQALSFAQVC